ncbi:MAG: PAS domain S-box protein, partial [Thermovirgaceae bacterium]|nr:PAS domain S-box protein [Thermovirgaceae bacterium]
MVQKRDPEDGKKGKEVISNEHERQKVFLELLVETIPSPVFCKDTDGFYTGCNKAFEEFTGLAREEIIGKTVFDMGPRDIAEKYAEMDEELYRNPGKQSYEWKVKSRDGEIRKVLFHKASIPGPDGKSIGLVGIITDITERKQTESLLADSEQRARRKIETILDPEADIGELELSDIIDSKELQLIFDDFYGITGLPMALNDLKDKTLVSNGWQDICTRFHRANPDSCRNCIESNLELTANVEPGKFLLYKCKNNMSNIAAPIFLDNRKFGNLFMGQLFFDDEETDYEVFREQARKYGYDEKEYMAALERVPRFSRETVERAMSFFTRLAGLISAQGLSNLKLAHSIEQNRSLIDDLVSSREMFDLFLNSTTDIAFLKNSELRYVIVNDACLKFLKKSRDEVIGRTDLELLPCDLAEQCLKGDEEVLRRGSPITRQEFGEGGVFESRKSPVTSRDGTTGIGGFIRDVTDAWKTGEALKDSEERFRSVFENTTIGLYRTTPGGKILMANPALLKMHGYSTFEELAERDLSRDVYGPNYQRKTFMEKIESEGEIIGLEAAWTRRDGTTLFVRESARVFRDPDGKVLYYEGTVEDITDRKRAEEALKKSEEKLGSIFRNMTDVVWTSDLDMKTTFVSPSVETLLGVTPEEYMKQSMEEKVPPHSLEMIRSVMVEELKAEKDPDCDRNRSRLMELEQYRADGTTVWTEMNVSFVRDENGNAVGVLGTTRDITERKNTEEKLRRALQATIQVLTQTVERRDPYTAGHQKRVAALAGEIAAGMGLAPERIEDIYTAGLVHDIGKMSVPSEILSKPGKLSEVEMNLIREHPAHGFDILKDVETAWPLDEIVYQHHERMDGSGYPRGLKGSDIILEARILAVADVVEAMASHRPYRPTRGIEAALDEIEKNRGILY